MVPEGAILLVPDGSILLLTVQFRRFSFAASRWLNLFGSIHGFDFAGLPRFRWCIDFAGLRPFNFAGWLQFFDFICCNFVGFRCILMARSSRSDFASSRRFVFSGDISILTVQICWFQMARFSWLQMGLILLDCFDFAHLIGFCSFKTVRFCWLVVIFRFYQLQYSNSVVILQVPFVF